jgi:hypothetical protein
MAYRVDWSENARGSKATYLSSLQRFDQGIIAIEWALARKPYLSPKIGGCSLRCTTLGPFRHEDGKSTCVVKVFFKIISANEVRIEWLEARPIGDSN